MQYGKHVIFLGAGASAGSGYPLANDLRLRISSLKIFLETVKNAAGDKWSAHLEHLTKKFFQQYENALTVFRGGGFGTIDEFCKLVTGSGSTTTEGAVNEMRVITSVALAIANPEDKFETSEYYPFVQRLFKRNLYELRDDITILSYNYDPFLEFLLDRAVRERYGFASSNGIAMPSDVPLEISGGYSQVSNQTWLDPGNPRFKLLKLHGVMATPAQYGLLFRDGIEQRLSKLLSGQHIPPIYFPWEVSNPKTTLSHLGTQQAELCRKVWEMT
jgi:hypothetical protein